LLEWVLGLSLVVDVEFHEGCADFGVLFEGWGVGDAGEFALEVGGLGVVLVIAPEFRAFYRIYSR
jgi:hypothetical protein